MTEINKIIKVKDKEFNGGKYTGGWNLSNGRPDGQGEFTLSNGYTYKGSLINGKAEGHGTIIFPDGNIYEGNFVNDKREGYGEYTTKDGDSYKGGFKDNKFHGKGILRYRCGDAVYDGNFKEGKRSGEGKLIVSNKKTKEPLYIQIFNKHGIMEKVKYYFNKERLYTLDIDYIALNEDLKKDNKIEKTEDFRKYMTVCGEKNRRIEVFDTIKLLESCTVFQIQTKSISEDDGITIDDESIVNGTNTGLINLIIFSRLYNNIEAMKNVLFIAEENTPNWPIEVYKNKKQFLNNLNPKSLNKGIVSLCATTDTKNHMVALVVVFHKINNVNESAIPFIYIYDSSRAITHIPKEVGDLGDIKEYFCNHIQQVFNSCGLNAACAVIAAAKHPGIFNEEIKLEDGKLNNFEILQILTLQEVFCDFGKEKFNINNRKKRVINHVVEEDIRNLIKREAEGIIGDYTLLPNLGISKWGTYLSTLIVAKKRGLLNEHDIDEKKTAEKLKEMDIKNLEELDQRLLNRFKEISGATDKKSLSRANDELKSLTNDTKIELLKKVNKKITEELPAKTSLLQPNKKNN